MFININRFLVLIVSITLADSFNTAPGTVTLSIGMPELMESSSTEEWQYDLEFCIGSGRLSEEQCSLLSRQAQSGKYSLGQSFVINKSFDAADIKSSFYFNAKFSFYSSSKPTKIIRFKDSVFQYSPHPLSLHSDTFDSLTMEITVKCKPGFYPQFQCTRSCFAVPGVSDCDQNGMKVCANGYIQSTTSGDCIKDTCKSNPGICQNNATCENEATSIICVCQPYYSGTACENWAPCKDHKCTNSATCIERTPPLKYVCQCKENYYGQFCEHYTDLCKDKRCPPDSLCQVKEGMAVCAESIKIDDPIDSRRWFSERQKKSTMGQMLAMRTEAIPSVVREGSDVVRRETVKLIQYPSPIDYTTVSIIIVLLVFMICSFTIIFWIQMNRYFHRRNKCDTHVDRFQAPSIIPMRNQEMYDTTMKRWHSLDDGFQTTWHNHKNCSQFSVMSYKPSFSTCDRQGAGHDTYRFSYKYEWPASTLKTTVPTMHESNHLGSSNGTGVHLHETTQTDRLSEEYCSPIIDNSDLPMPDNSST